MIRGNLPRRDTTPVTLLNDPSIRLYFGNGVSPYAPTDGRFFPGKLIFPFSWSYFLLHSEFPFY